MSHGPASSASDLRRDEESQLQQRSTTQRLYQLDALRGIAAAVVVAHHTRLAEHFYEPRWFLVPLFAGAQAVALFFVLSGFVLTLPYWANNQSTYPVYLVRRFTRIYLPFAVAAALSVLGASIFYKSHPPLSPWFHNTWNLRITPRLVLAQFRMVTFPVFNTAFWSITYEMSISCFIPFMVWIMRKTNPLLVCVITCGIAFGTHRVVVDPNSPTHWNLILQIPCLFAFGAALARYQNELRRRLRRSPAASWLFLAVCLWLFYDLPELLSADFYRVLHWRSLLLSGIGAAGIIVCALELKPFSRLLRHGFFEYLGRISYSLYLTHSIVIFALFDLLYGKIPSPLIYLAIALSVLGLAHLFCVMVEEPCILIGKRLKLRAIAATSQPDPSSLPSALPSFSRNPPEHETSLRAH